MKFYTHQHKHYCGIDLHARAMHVCILDQSGTKLVRKNLPTTLEAFLRLSAARIGKILPWEVGVHFHVASAVFFKRLPPGPGPGLRAVRLPADGGCRPRWW